MHVPVGPRPWQQLMSEIAPQRVAELAQFFRQSPPQEYHHWDRVLHRPPPAGLTRDEWWVALKIGRLITQKPIPLQDTSARPFFISMPDAVLRSLHLLDQQLAGRIAAPEAITTAGSRDRFLISSLIEEAVTSSQLEGAVTSRRVAVQMLRSGRPPADRSERMIVNNYRAMQHVRQVLDRPLTADLLMELHRIVTEGTLDDPGCAGRLERPDETRVKVWGQDDQVLHIPPPAEELPGRLTALCAFANGQDADGQGFMHPIVRAIVLHFWMGYDHYVADGNGRTARALFYWSMLRSGYWLAEFLTISAILRKAPTAYAQAFLLTETDDNDLTYFVLAQLDVLERAVQELMAYLARKSAEVREVEALLRGGMRLNHRQQAVLGVALRDPERIFTIAEHQASHDVVYQTARTDLLDLVERRLLRKDRQGLPLLGGAGPQYPAQPKRYYLPVILVAPW